MVYMYNGLYSALKREGKSDIYNKMDEFVGCDVKGSKSDTEELIIHEVSEMVKLRESESRKVVTRG